MAKQGAHRTIYVYADWVGLGHPTLMGLLHSTLLRGKEIFSFWYDSVVNAIRQSPSDTTTIQLYHLLSSEMLLRDSAAARAYEDSAMYIARRIKSPKHISTTLTNIGEIYRNRSEFARANTYYKNR